MNFTCQRYPGQQKKSIVDAYADHCFDLSNLTPEQEHSGLSKRWELPSVATDFDVVGMKDLFFCCPNWSGAQEYCCGGG